MALDQCMSIGFPCFWWYSKWCCFKSVYFLLSDQLEGSFGCVCGHTELWSVLSLRFSFAVVCEQKMSSPLRERQLNARPMAH